MQKMKKESRSAEGAAAQWRVILARKPSDQSFLYGVTTTRVFCRPGCRSRTPHRANVRFFESADQAVAAGYRPCKRCQPHDRRPEGDHLERIAAACRLLQRNESTSLADLARAVGVSRHHFHRIFRATLGVTPKQYAAMQRFDRLKQKLRRGGEIGAAIYEVGFGSSSRVYEQASRRLGMTPRAYRDGGAQEEIRFTVANTTLGTVLIAATRKGVCAIEIGDRETQLLDSLRTAFPKAHLMRDQGGLGQISKMLNLFLETPRNSLSLPLDVRGTAFQCRVWRALQKIAPGETISYSDLARRINSPRAARAVASACAANRIALAIPCHRVQRSDGYSGGYRWGIKRKKALLTAEAHR
jgi:AraC family transcriptional regulator, regulatory protein of adaptative response / methylated-DNA-[protein]-cysteine methyltransferase